MTKSDIKPALGNYLQSIFALLEKVEYRRITTRSDFEDIENLRKTAYESKTFIDSSHFGSFFDEDDISEDVFVIGVYINEQLVSTIRLHIVKPDHVHGPSSHLFPLPTLNLLNENQLIIDPSRFASDPLALWKYPAIPLLTLRSAAMAIEYFSAQMLIGSVREDASAFYKRCFGGELVCPPTVLKGYSVPLVMLACPVAAIYEKMQTNYPFFKSQPYERKLMFAPQNELRYPSLTILPSAKYAQDI
jgi:hypothetical protein